MNESLMSVAKRLDTGLSFVWRKDGYRIMDGNSTGLERARSRNCFILPSTVTIATATVPSNLTPIWHERLRHLSKRGMSHIHRSVANLGPLDLKGFEDVCSPCVKGKQHHLPYKATVSHARYKGYLVHLDLYGPFQVASLGGSIYLISFTDDYSHYSIIFLISNKIVGYSVRQVYGVPGNDSSGCESEGREDSRQRVYGYIPQVPSCTTHPASNHGHIHSTNERHLRTAQSYIAGDGQANASGAQHSIMLLGGSSRHGNAYQELYTTCLDRVQNSI
jgi:GAG-pre-integrase domain